VITGRYAFDIDYVEIIGDDDKLWVEGIKVSLKRRPPLLFWFWAEVSSNVTDPDGAYQFTGLIKHCKFLKELKDAKQS
jgi:hypothetical protein